MSREPGFTSMSTSGILHVSIQRMRPLMEGYTHQRIITETKKLLFNILFLLLEQVQFKLRKANQNYKCDISYHVFIKLYELADKFEDCHFHFRNLEEQARLIKEYERQITLLSFSVQKNAMRQLLKTALIIDMLQYNILSYLINLILLTLLH